MISAFMRDESGAVTVDYVVLTGAAVGLGMSVTSYMSGGMRDFNESVVRALASPMHHMTLFSDNFSDGGPDWVGGEARNIRGFGDVLLLTRQRPASIELGFPRGAREGILSFDVIAGDSLDNESSTFFIDGQAVGSITRNWRGSSNYRAFESEGIKVSYEQLEGGRGLGGNLNWSDEIIRVTIRLDDPARSVTFRANTNTNQSWQDEFYALDNFSSSFR